MAVQFMSSPKGSSNTASDYSAMVCRRPVNDNIIHVMALPGPSDSGEQNTPELLSSFSQAFKQSSSTSKGSKLGQDGRFQKGGKRWVRRRDNSQFVANPHVVKPAPNDFGVYSPSPNVTFPEPLPPFISRRVVAPSALLPRRDPACSNAGRYSFSLKGVRRDLRRSGPRSEQIVLDIEQELVQWLHSGGIIISPDQAPSIGVPGKPLGTSNSITEISRSPTELIWRIDGDYPRFLLHCVARFHGVVSFSKTGPENDVRITHLLRPNVARPDFAAPGTLHTPPASDIDTFSVIIDTEDSDVMSVISSEASGDLGESHIYVLEEERAYEDSSPQEHDFVQTELSVDKELLKGIASASLAESSRDWEYCSTRQDSCPPSRASRPFRRRTRRAPSMRSVADQQLRFWSYVFT